MNSYADERGRMTRKEAADYLTRKWFRMSVSTLAKLASQRLGPVYVNRGPNRGGEAFYTKEALDLWARSYLNPRSRAASTQIGAVR